MPGYFRRLLVAPKKSLSGYLQVKLQTPSGDLDGPESEKRAFGNFRKEVRDNLSAIESSIKTLDTKNVEWLQFLGTCKEDTKAIEEKEYDDMIEGPDGVLILLERARYAAWRRQSLLSDIDDKLKSLSAAGMARASHNLEDENGSQSVRQSSEPRVKLPRITLQKFDGDLKAWPAFWGSFEAAVHKQNIPKVEKLTYLLSLLKGKAKQCVQGFPVREENYKIVVDTLTAKFGQNEILLACLYRDLRSLQCAEKVTIHNICAFVDEMECILRQLEALGEDLDHACVECILEKKLPTWVLEKIEEAKDNSEDPWTFSDVRQFLQKITKHKEKANMLSAEKQRLRSEDATGNFTKRFVKPQFKPFEKRTQFSSTLTAIRDENVESEEGIVAAARPSAPVRCYFCGEKHVARKCQKYATPQGKCNIAQELKLCLRCLHPNHTAENCTTPGIRCHICNGSHFAALCLKQKSERVAESAATYVALEEVTNKAGTSSEQANCSITSVVVAVQGNLISEVENEIVREEILMMCKEIFLCNPEDPSKREKILLFFDTGSHQTYVDKDVAERLGLEMSSPTSSLISTFGSKKPIKVATNRVSVGIELANGEVKTIYASTVEYLTKSLPVAKISRDDLVSLKSDAVLRTERVWQCPRILIGSDYCFGFLNSVHGEAMGSGFNCIETNVGPIKAGRGYVESGLLSEETGHAYCALNVDDLFPLETIGIDDCHVAKDDDVAFEIFNQSLTRDERGRYSVSWPWRDKMPALTKNFGLCAGRLKSVIEKFKGRPDILEQYDKTFKEQLDLGIIELAPSREQSEIVHFLSHQAVLTPGKTTTKLRIVFDASSKSKGGCSLNDCLYRGPVFLPELVGVLLRFRTKKFVMLADVEKAFLQVGLHTADREVTRFLWVKDLNLPPEGENLVVYRYCRVLFGVVASPFLLAATIRHHLGKSNSFLAPSLLENLYVDNVVLTTDNLEEANSWYEESKNVFGEASMNLREYVCNVAEVQGKIPVGDRHMREDVSVLGIPWSVSKDTLSLETLRWNLDKVTKRTVVRFMQRHFDPMGFLVPILLRWKILCQNLWRRKLDWDDLLDENSLLEFEYLLSTWKQYEFVVPRLASSLPLREIHVFVDASLVAYSTAIYAVFSANGQSETKLIFARSRLAPLEGLTVPRAELLGTLIGARALKFLRRELQLGNCQIFAWCDSKGVIAWLENNKFENFEKFVRNRVKEISERKITFRCVPTDMNPADLGTRGLSPEELLCNRFWWEGPTWLGDQNIWPADEKVEVSKEPLPFLKSYREKQAKLANAVLTSTENLSEFVNLDRFKKWKVLLAATANALLYLWKIKRTKRPAFMSSFKSGSDLHEAKRVAENLLLKQARLEIRQQDVEKWNLVRSKDSLWRIDARLKNARNPGTSPIFLPRENRMTKLLILQSHEEILHGGVAHTLTRKERNFGRKRED